MYELVKQCFHTAFIVHLNDCILRNCASGKIKKDDIRLVLHVLHVKRISSHVRHYPFKRVHD